MTERGKSNDLHVVVAAVGDCFVWSALGSTARWVGSRIPGAWFFESCYSFVRTGMSWRREAPRFTTGLQKKLARAGITSACERFLFPPGKLPRGLSSWFVSREITLWNPILWNCSHDFPVNQRVYIEKKP